MILLQPLAWDTQHLGYAVAHITRPCVPVVELRAALQRACAQEIPLVYWRASPDANVPADLIEQYAGLRAAVQVVFECDLFGPNDNTPERPRDCFIGEYSNAVASPALVDLAKAAGAYSRFRVDPHIAPNEFASLYETWIERSTRREIADVVLVASYTRGLPDILGLVTLSVNGTTGLIGLLAVAEKARRRGIGRALLETAHCRMREKGAVRSRVETQLANRPACALYARAGYRPTAVEHIYHFWPQARRDIAPTTRRDSS
jgi:GNAT superfamily N-acetyltransferase